MVVVGFKVGGIIYDLEWVKFLSSANGVWIVAGRNVFEVLELLNTSYSVINLVIGYIVFHIVGLTAVM